MDNKIEYVMSEKNKERALFKGYLYHKEKTSTQDVTFWRCIFRVKTNCKSRLHTINDNVVKTVDNHNHSADA